MKTLTRTSFLAVPVLALCMLTMQQSLAEETHFGTRTPSVNEFVEALDPAQGPRMRGIRPASTAAIATTAAAASAASAAAAAPAAGVQSLGSAESEQPKVSMQLQFAFDSATLTAESMASLDNLSLALKSERLGNYGFRIEGHTDASGPEAYNQTLSERRATAVRAYLVEKHQVDPARLQIVGRGETDPLDVLNPYSGINRRVAIANLGVM